MLKLEKKYDAIIVGSGAGGGVVADILSQKGLKCLIIESGAYRKAEHFNQNESDMSAIYYNRGAVFSKNMHLALAAANAVGGSTSVYTGVSFRPPQDVLNKWKSEFGLDFLTDDFVNSTLDSFDSDLNIHELPDDEINENNKLFKTAAESLGINVKKLKLNLVNCNGQGFCNLGCTQNAKQGTLVVQLPRAIANGAELVHHATVDTISENAVYFSVREATAGVKENLLPTGTYAASAKVIILAAGVLNTPAILLRSVKQLQVNNPNIGRFITLHPAFNLHAVNKNKITNYTGFPKAYYIDQYSETEGYYLETSFYYRGITSKNIPDWGEQHAELMSNYNKMMSILILSHDKAKYENRITINKKGQPVINYKVAPETKTSLVNAIRKAAEIFIAAGCTSFRLPATKQIITQSDKNNLNELIQEKYLDFAQTPLSTAHPQGGCRMGTSEKTSVVDINGKLWGSKSIYVADASLFPTSVKVNPYETIMLLATHVAKQNFDKA